jgi:hypothetical protein
MRRRILAALAALLVPALTASADNLPKSFSYQGVLNDANGHPVQDGNYNLTFRIYSGATGGNALWTEADNVAVQGGVFSVVLGHVTALNLAFDIPYWMGITVAAGSEMTPRVEMTSAPYARSASFADSARVGSDADWTISGSDIYRLDGHVGIGTYPTLRQAPESKPGAPPFTRDRNPARLSVAVNDDIAIYATLTETNNLGDGRSAIYGYRNESTTNPGSGYQVSATNNAITGYNYWGENYTFGVAGYCYNDYTLTGGVLGAQWDGSIWGALAYKDAGSQTWGLYTPNSVYIGGGFKMPTGGGAGKVLTSDANGVGTWQAAGGTGDITAVYADNGLGGGATSGDAHLNVNTGTGLEIASDNVQLTSPYSTGSAYDARFVNEGQASSVTSSMISDGAVAFADLANPTDLGGFVWYWSMTTGNIQASKSTNYPLARFDNTNSTSDGDVLYLETTSASAGSGTWTLYANNYKGETGYFYKATDDNQYAVYIQSPGSNSEGLYVVGNTVATGTKSAVVETSQGREAIFSVESPEVEIYASGTARLSNGGAQVPFDRLFTEAISAQTPVKVTVTPVGAWSALYVEARTTGGFVVRSASGDANVAFDWMACGRRAGYDARPQISIPDPQEQDRLRQAKAQARGR